MRLQTDYTYDGYGNKLSVTVSGSGIASRTTSSIYDSRGQFPTTTTNALGHSDTGAYDARFGKAATLTGPNGLTTTWSYDGFGRKINETRADATQTNIAYNLCDATCPNFAKYYVSSTTLGSPTSYAYYDMLNREIRVQTQGFDGRLVTKDTYYDSFGRVDRVTKPYYAGDSPLYSYLAYDGLGRAIQETTPDNSTKQIAYNGLTTSVTNALAQTETKTKNSQGQLVSVTDNLNNVITYQYDPFGNLTKTIDPKGNQTTLTYDARGRKIGMVDPDMGSWTYTYNVLGELIQQRDAKLQIVNMSYDLLGRMQSRSEPDLNSTWVYDTASKGVGKLKQVSSDNGFLRVYTYDSLGRVSSETSTIDTTYNVSKTYDVYGRVSVLTYPTCVTVKNVYNAYGYLAEVRNNATSALFWKGNAKDADGHVLNETLGNGLTTTRTYTATTGRVASIAVGPNGNIQNQSFMFDNLGNLIYRYDPAQAQSETFSYDGLNRLITTTKGATTTTVAYDSIGNITNKSDVGDYTYGAKPHAVTQVASSGGAAVPAMNVALQANGGVASASSFYNSSYSAAAINNGDRKGLNWGNGGGWNDATNFAYPDWVQIDFNGNKTINEIDVYTLQDNYTAPVEPTASMTFSNYGITQFDVQYWNGSAWATVPGGAISGNNKVKVKLSFANITTSKIRVQVNNSLLGYSRITEVEAWTPAITGGGATTTYAYDPNGNLTSGAGRTVTYTSYNQPSQITTSTASVNFIYDADHTRIRQISSSETMIYLNPRIDAGMHFEKEVKGGVTEYKHYIYGAAGVMGIYTTSSAASPNTRYFHQDHLGSIVAVTDDAAVVVARYAFDPWGKRILLAGDADATHHGFTGHEHLSDVGLVHMNGRIYDPILARFMSADPYIQAPDNLQSYNRYSYVWNNPLSATDPSGYFSWKKVFKTALRVAIFGPIAAIPSVGKQIDHLIATNPYLRAAGQIAAAYYGGPWGAAIFSAYSTAASGGSVGDMTKSFVITLATASAFKGVGDKWDVGSFENIAGHAAVGCVSSVAGGGSCQSGAASAGLGALADGLKLSDVAGLVAHAVAGGVGAELGGGKFANGAVTGAMGYLFNFMMHKREIRYFNKATGEYEVHNRYVVRFAPFASGDSAASSIAGLSDEYAWRALRGTQKILYRVLDMIAPDGYGTHDLSGFGERWDAYKLEGQLKSLAVSHGLDTSAGGSSADQVRLFLNDAQKIPGFTDTYGTTDTFLRNVDNK